MFTNFLIAEEELTHSINYSQGQLYTGHHWCWTGTPDMRVPLGTVFSFIEVLPLTLLIIDAIEELQIMGRYKF